MPYDGRVRSILTTSLVLGAILCTSVAQAQDGDRWWGRDKALHFGVSAGLAVGGYAAGLALFDCEVPRLVLGGSVALTAGIAKELWDLGGGGDASLRDLTWDVIGTAVGLLVSWGLDLLLLPRRCDVAGARASP